MTTDKKGLRPRNLTARSSYAVAGNPATAYPEDAVANCYPGLELDIRNFDRRFFPGLVFEFVARDDVDAAYSLPHRYGARLSYVETDQDPELQLPEAAKLLADLTGDAGSRLGDGVWYLEWLEQDGRRISMRWRRDGALMPMDGLWVWRLVRGLEPLPKPLRIGLRQRPESEPGAAEAAKRGKPDEVVLEGFRRTFQDPTSGVISTVYQPGELLQSLCSPWQHDFRDCACHYWASNHPDVVLGEVLPGEPTLPGGLPAEPEPAQVLLDWLRADRRRAVAASALDTIGKNRPFQLDAFQINHAWHELAVVLNDTESDGLYVPDALASANPFASPAELAKELRERLAPLEMTLAIEYLYARFSIIDPKQAPKGRWPGLADDVVFVRDYLMLVSVSEMTHMRWANQLLWELYEHGLVPSYEPVLEPALKVPTSPGETRDRSLRRLEPLVLDDFIAVERPSNFIDGAYARVIVTLRQKEYPPHMVQLAERIASDGMQHESRFRYIKHVLNAYKAAAPDFPYLRPLTPAAPDDPAVEDALRLYEIIRKGLDAAYREAARGDFAQSGEGVVDARTAMNQLRDLGEELAAKGIGIPFWPPP